MTENNQIESRMNDMKASLNRVSSNRCTNVNSSVKKRGDKTEKRLIDSGNNRNANESKNLFCFDVCVFFTVSAVNIHYIFCDGPHSSHWLRFFCFTKKPKQKQQKVRSINKKIPRWMPSENEFSETLSYFSLSKSIFSVPSENEISLPFSVKFDCFCNVNYSWLAFSIRTKGVKKNLVRTKQNSINN